MRLRPSRILAIADRDLRSELKGRGGKILPGIAMAILLPIAVGPGIPDRPLEQGLIRVGGDVPPEVLAEARVRVEPEKAFLWFVAPPEGSGEPWIIRGDYIPRVVGDVMDELHPGMRTEMVEFTSWHMPQRSLFLSLISASILTGAIAQSMAGERAQRTMETLLTASVSRAEVVTGKWLAWGGFGAAACASTIALTVALGRQEPGWWMWPAPFVSFGTAAMGLWLVRRAQDIVGGASTTIRILPAALTLLGLIAWVLGHQNPLLGALVPFGGALIASGDLWPGPVPAVISILSSLAVSAAFIAATARDLEPDGAPSDPRSVLVMSTTSMALGAWWLCILGPLIWTWGGNAEMTSDLPVTRGASSAGFALALLVAVRLGHARDPWEAIGLRRSRPAGYAAAAAGAIIWALVPPLPWVTGRLLDAANRMDAALLGATALAIFPAIAQELFLRGWLRRIGGDAIQIGATILMLTPLDPLRGLLLGLLTTAAVRLGGGSVLPAIALRLLHIPAAAVWG